MAAVDSMVILYGWARSLGGPRVIVRASTSLYYISCVLQFRNLGLCKPQLFVFFFVGGGNIGPRRLCSIPLGVLMVQLDTRPVGKFKELLST